MYLVGSDAQGSGGGFLKYSGEILEMNLADWVLKNSAPPMGELSVNTPAGTW